MNRRYIAFWNKYDNSYSIVRNKRHARETAHILGHTQFSLIRVPKNLEPAQYARFLCNDVVGPHHKKWHKV